MTKRTSPWSPVSLRRPTLVKVWFVYIATTQMCLSHWSVVCVSEGAPVPGADGLERWTGTVLDTNATCADLGSQCLQLLVMHDLSQCYTTSYLYRKGKINALNTLLTGDLPGMYTVLGRWAPRRRIWWRRQNVHRTVWSATGDNHGVCPLHQEEDKSQSQILPPTCSCTFCGPICRSRCGKRQTSEPRLVSQKVSLSSAGISGMTSPLLLLHRVTMTPVWFDSLRV